MPLTFENPGFEDEQTTGTVLLNPDKTTVSAEGWATSFTSSVWEAAVFVVASGEIAGGTYNLGVERFGFGWSTADESPTFEYEHPANPSELGTAVFEAGATPQALEDHENEWGPFDGTNTDFATKVGAGFLSNTTTYLEFTDFASESAAFDATPQAFEDHENEWGPFDGTNPDFATKVGAGHVANDFTPLDWGDVTSGTASFDTGTPENFEDFEDEWGFVAFGGWQNPNFGGVAQPETFEDLVAFADLITVAGSTDGQYTVLINGRAHVFVASGNTVTQIRDGLISAITGTPEKVAATANSTDKIDIASIGLPADYIIGVSAPAANLQLTTYKENGTDWSQRLAAATL